MIMLTRLSGSAFVLNADLIERLDHTPDTVVTLVDGKKYVVAEDMAEVVSLVRAWRGGIIAAGSVVAGDDQLPATRGHLAPVALHPTQQGDA
jgi:flagellar protein FlbD